MKRDVDIIFREADVFPRMQCGAALDSSSLMVETQFFCFFSSLEIYSYDARHPISFSRSHREKCGMNGSGYLHPTDTAAKWMRNVKVNLITFCHVLES